MKPSVFTLQQAPRTDFRRAQGLPETTRPTTLRQLIDSHGRVIRDLRLSITDRCNFRCVYCMSPDVRFMAADRLLTVDELVRVARLCITLGVERIRLTGGEPTLHPRLDEIIQRISDLGEGGGVTDLSMTTNGSLAAPERLAEWRRCGLTRLTFSLDSLNPATFSAMTRSTTPVATVLAAIRDAKAAGLGPIKVNAVVVRGCNEEEVGPLAALAAEIGFEMRFIEWMPLDAGHAWTPERLVPASEIAERIHATIPIAPVGKAAPHSTSETWTFQAPHAPGAAIGIIAPVTRPFCGACSRLRITADGQLRPCLFSLDETDIRSALRSGASDDDLTNLILDAAWAKQSGHGITAPGFAQPERTMSAIGG